MRSTISNVDKIDYKQPPMSGAKISELPPPGNIEQLRAAEYDWTQANPESQKNPYAARIQEIIAPELCATVRYN